MTIMRNPLVLQQITFPNGACFVFNPVMGCNDDPGIENLETDLLVLTQMKGAAPSAGMEKLDASLSGALKTAIAANGFTGQSGESVLLDCRKLDCKPRHILVVGLGDYRQFKGCTVCGFMRKVLETAKQLAVAKITLPIFPNRQTEAAINLEGSAAILACRAATFANEFPALREIELFCTPQARRHLQQGLLARVPRCLACDNPELAKS